jgi:3-oxoacyl-[acyl-carrier-protein] synthase-3
MSIGIIDVECFLPSGRRSNADVVKTLGRWTADEIFKKIGIVERAVASNSEYASDLAVRAASKLFDRRPNLRGLVDLLIVCTQTPDYTIPTTACIVHKKLGFSKKVASFDINLGCSGFVYTLSVARSMLLSGDAEFALICCADTYTKHIGLQDAMTLPIFGDGASAVVLGRLKHGKTGIGKFIFGTDGSGWDQLIVPSSGSHSSLNSPHLPEADKNLRMNGPEIFRFTTNAIKLAFLEMEAKFGFSRLQADWVILHQASALILKHIITTCQLDEEKTPIELESTGNIVSSSIPFVLRKLMDSGKVKNNNRLLLLGFGVGYSWAGCHINWNSEDDFELDFGGI